MHDHEAQVQKISKNCMIRETFIKDITRVCNCTPCESFFTESQLVERKMS